MSLRNSPTSRFAAMLMLAMVSSGCSRPYKGVVKQTVKMSSFSPGLEDLSDAKIEAYLKASPRPDLPTVLAVARISGATMRALSYRNSGSRALDVIHSDEATGWRELVSKTDPGERGLIEQIQFVNPLLVNGSATLKNLRDAAARLHAPLLLVYGQVDDHDEGHNAAAIAYWTIVGLFLVPGHTVGHCSVCQGILIDTRTGAVLATVQGESKREEHVLPGALKIASRRTRKQACAEAVSQLQKDFFGTLKSFAPPEALSKASPNAGEN